MEASMASNLNFAKLMGIDEPLKVIVGEL